MDEINILLVEDNPADVELVRISFQEGKILARLSVAEDGEQAIDYLRRRGQFANAERPGLILMDLNLPRKDGREVLNEIKNDPDLKDIPVIVLTTSDAEADVLRAYKLHANCYLTKPIDVDEFLRKVRGIEAFWLQLVRLPRPRQY
jgi:CheY-like chemotaxis protein